MQHSTDFVSTVATIAVKAARYLGGSFTEQAAVDFAWWSVNEVGDAAEDDRDFGRHIRTWLQEVGEAGRLDEYQP